MATVALTTYTATDAGPSATVAWTAIDATDTYTFVNDGRSVLYVDNSDAGDAVFTIDVPRNVRGLAVTEPTVTVTGSTDEIIGPFPVTIYGTTVSVTNDKASGVNVAVINY